MRQMACVAEFMCIQYVGRSSCTTIGVLLLDRAANDLLIEFTHRLDGFDDLEAELITSLGDDLEAKALEMGGASLFDYLLASLSNTFRVTDPQPIIAENLDSALFQLATQYLVGTVEPKTAPLMEKPKQISAWWNTKMLIADVIQSGYVCARTAVGSVRPLRLVSVASCVASMACFGLILMMGVRAHRLATPDLQEGASAKSVSVRSKKEIPATILTIRNLENPVLLPVARSRALAIRKRLKGIAPSPTAPRLFVLPQPQRHRATKLAMVSLAELQVQPIAITAASAGMPVEMPSLPALPKQNSGALRRLAKAIAYPFIKIGTTLAE